jgi:hypothetical protein
VIRDVQHGFGMTNASQTLDYPLSAALKPTLTPSMSNHTTSKPQAVHGIASLQIDAELAFKIFRSVDPYATMGQQIGSRRISLETN